jgi:hypothetical protein
MRLQKFTATYFGEVLIRYAILSGCCSVDMHLSNENKNHAIASKVIKDPVKAVKNWRNMVIPCTHGAGEETRATDIVSVLGKVLPIYFQTKSLVPTTVIFLTDMAWDEKRDFIKDILQSLDDAKGEFNSRAEKEFENGLQKMEDYLLFKFVMFGNDARGHENFEILREFYRSESMPP